MVDFNAIKLNLNLPISSSAKICLYCQETQDAKSELATVNTSKSFLKGFKILRIEYLPLPNVTDYMCKKCVIRIITTVNIVRRMRGILSRRKFCSENKKKINETIVNKDFRSLSSKQNGVNQNKNSNSKNNAQIFNVSTISSSDSKENSNCFDELEKEFELGSSPKLLDVMYECSESVLETESGGNINLINEYNTQTHLKSNNCIFKCKYCTKTYRRHHFLKKHERIHLNKKRTVRKENESYPVNNFRFECYHCNMKFTRNAQLRAHEKSHQNHFICSYCNEEFFLQTDYQWHLAKCIGKASATTDAVTTRYRTRSQSVRNDMNTDEDENVYWNNEDITKWVKKSIPIDDDEKSLYSTSSLATSFSRASSRSDLTVETNNWSNTSMSTYEKSDDDNISIRTGGSFARRSKKRKGAMKNKFNCPEPNCGFFGKTIEKVMYHDMKEHSELLLYYCKKCKGRFVRKIYLDYHLMNQSSGPFICYICKEDFIFSHELKDHFDIHRYSCNICHISFQKAEDVIYHKNSEAHIRKEASISTTLFERYDYKELETDDENSSDSVIKYEAKVKILKLIDNEIITKYESPSRTDWQKWRIGTTLHHIKSLYNCSDSKEQMKFKKVEDFFEMEMLQNNEL